MNDVIERTRTWAAICLIVVLSAAVAPPAAGADCCGSACQCCASPSGANVELDRPGCCEVAPVRGEAAGSSAILAPTVEPLQGSTDVARVEPAHRAPHHRSRPVIAGPPSPAPPPSSFLLHCAFLI